MAKKTLKTAPGDQSSNHRRSKLYNSNQIRNELQDPAFTRPTHDNTSKDVINVNDMGNKLDIPSFLASRRKEIDSFEKAQLRSRYSSSARIFQTLPRELRRRTASHNVRRIPKRMRPRAIKEMGLTMEGQETKGVTESGKPQTEKHPRGRQLYHLRRRSKLLKYAAKHKLSGHLIDGEVVNIKKLNVRDKLKEIKKQISRIEEERAGGSPSKIPHLNNLAGSYDNTGVNESANQHQISSLKYATRQAKFKWLPTHVWHAKRAKMIKRWGWNLVNQPTMKCFRKTSRSSRDKGCIAWDTSFLNTVIVSIDSDDLDPLIKIVSLLTRGLAAKPNFTSGRKAWEGFLSDGDQPLCIGSVLFFQKQVMIRFHPSVHDRMITFFKQLVHDRPEINFQDCRYSIGSIKVAGPKALSSLQVIFHEANETPAYQIWRQLARLNDTSSMPEGFYFAFDIQDPRFNNEHSLPHVNMEADDVLEAIFQVREGKGVNSASLAKLLSIEGRTESYKNQSTLKQLGQRHAPERSGQPIPVTANDPAVPICVVRRSDSYDVIAPWFWILPIWYQLVHVPHLMIGGLKQMQQLSFEKCQLGVNDLAFTPQGYADGNVQLDENEMRYYRRPKSKRLRFDSIMLGSEKGEALSPFGCDWRGLQLLRYGLRKLPDDAPTAIGPSMFDPVTLGRIINTKYDLFEMIKDIKSVGPPKVLPIKLGPSQPTVDFEMTPDGVPPLNVTPISFKCTARGNITDYARIYKIPDDSKDGWLTFASNSEKDILGHNVSTSPLGVPGSENLIGLTTSATYNLVEGQSTGIGFIDSSELPLDRYVLVRNVGSNICHPATWSEIDFK